MAAGPETVLKVVEPATEGILAELPHANAAEADAAVERAKRAFPAWRAVAPADRARACYARLADALEAHADELAVLEARNAGKPIGDARGEIGHGRRHASATTRARPSGCWATRSRSPAAST